MIKRVYSAYFSGTGTTEKVVKLIGEYLASKLKAKYEEWDFTSAKARREIKRFDKSDLVIFGTPVIAGRVPNLLLEYLHTLEGNGAATVPIVLYGNRNYDDALVELRDILQDAGMVPIGAGAFVGEHSFSKILAKGRPDKADLLLAEKFAEIIYRKISCKDFENEMKIPGESKPYRGYYQPRDRKGQPIDIRKVKPKTDKTKCNDCKLCAKICPLESIDFADVSQVPGVCMKCCGCIKKCPQRAKYFDDKGYIYHKEELEAQYIQRREPEFFA